MCSGRLLPGEFTLAMHAMINGAWLLLHGGMSAVAVLLSMLCEHVSGYMVTQSPMACADLSELHARQQALL